MRALCAAPLFATPQRRWRGMASSNVRQTRGDDALISLRACASRRYQTRAALAASRAARNISSENQRSVTWRNGGVRIEQQSAREKSAAAAATQRIIGVAK